MEALRVQGLGKSFGSLTVLRDVSFSLDEGGRRLVIIGPNGAGKSTLFNLIAGEWPPTEGKVFLFSHEVTKMPCHRRAQLGLGRTFQRSDLFPYFTVLENVLLALQVRKPFRYQMLRPITAYRSLYDRAEALLEGIGLWTKRNYPVTALSHGEMRKVELILGLAVEPRLLLLDEPTAGLTASEAEQFAGVMRELLRDTTVVIIEHDMKVAFALAERIIVLHQGSIVADGQPEDIRANPRVKEVYLGEEEKEGATAAPDSVG